MRDNMYPKVLQELQFDLSVYGNCIYSIVDDEDEFSIQRHDPNRYYYSLEVR